MIVRVRSGRLRRRCFSCLIEFTSSDTYAFIIMVNSRSVASGKDGQVVNELPSYMLCYTCSEKTIDSLNTDRNRNIKELVERENKE